MKIPFQAPWSLPNPDVCTTHLEHVDVTLALEDDSGKYEGGGVHKHKQAQGLNKLKYQGRKLLIVKCCKTRAEIRNTGQIRSYAHTFYWYDI